MKPSDIQNLISNPNIKILGLREHTKASEKYVDVSFQYPRRKAILVSIPFYYRRRGLFLNTPSEVADLVSSIYPLYEERRAKIWVKNERTLWKKSHSSKEVTKEFFIKLLNLGWNCVDCDLPKNRNWARRIQDIKEMGYLLATNTRLPCSKCKNRTTHILLIPFDKATSTGYETLSPALKKRIIKVLGGINAYEGKRVGSANALIPDHKFSEIRWDEKTRSENLDTMTDEEIRDKFQLLDNQRNQQKREICRKCFQTGERGTIFGIDYYYRGNDKWGEGIPITGKEAEKGCVGCPWYDIEKWRQNFNKIPKSS